MVVNSLQAPSHCACVVNRGRWDADYSVVGHRGAVTVVRFNPLLFEDPESDDPCSCFALGAQVASISLFGKRLERKVLVVPWPKLVKYGSFWEHPRLCGF
jgi:protein HIRA/HIR1